MMDRISEARLLDVYPELARRIRQMFDLLVLENITIEVTQALRTFSQQDQLYAIGRTAPGKIVTNAKAGESWHNYGCAVDVAPFDDGIPDWDASHPAWARIVAIGISLGLTNGISWKDEPHFELTGKYPPDPPLEVRNLYLNGGVEAVWKAVQN